MNAGRSKSRFCREDHQNFIDEARTDFELLKNVLLEENKIATIRLTLKEISFQLHEKNKKKTLLDENEGGW